MPDSLLIKQILSGQLENFTYILGDKAFGEAFVIDPSGPWAEILHELKKEGMNLAGILLTHGHYDHVEGVDKVQVPVYLSKFEAMMFTPKARNLVRTEDGCKLKVGALTVECLHAPGHTPGCQCFLIDGNLFTGDVLFIDAVGRTDFPGGNTRVMFESLQRLKRLPNTTMIWPGHQYGSATHETLGSLKVHNPFLSCDDIREFINYLS